MWWSFGRSVGEAGLQPLVTMASSRAGQHFPSWEEAESSGDPWFMDMVLGLEAYIWESGPVRSICSLRGQPAAAPLLALCLWLSDPHPDLCPLHPTSWPDCAELAWGASPGLPRGGWASAPPGHGRASGIHQVLLPKSRAFEQA